MLQSLKILFLLLAPFLPCDARAQYMEVSVLEKQTLFREEVERKIKKEILDPVLGKDRAFVFADVRFDVITRKSSEGTVKEGALQKYKEGGRQSKSPLDDFLLPGVPKPKSITREKERPEMSQGMAARQSKSADAIRYGIETDISKFRVTVIHDETLPRNDVILARSRVDDFLAPYRVGENESPPEIVFKPTKFKSRDMLDDLKSPGVYIPLLYALLALLLLFFLFGPLWGFFRKYVRALMAKPGAEVNIENREEERKGGGAEEGKEESHQEGHQDIDMNFTQNEGEGEESEEDMMKNFKPFSYINEDNLKKLGYLFLTRKEEPWVIAVILSYLNPELSKQLLNMLPVEIQSKVALETLTVRQASYEQIKAIDRDIRESIDFIIGGVEGISRILAEADLNTQKNILEYLKTQKPEVYDRVRKIIFLFEDMVNLKDKDIQTLIRNSTNDNVAKAIKNADPQIVDKFFKNMSEGAVRQVKEIMEYSRDVTETQIGDAQNKIVETVKLLIAKGEIPPLHEQSQELYILDSVDMRGKQEKKDRLLQGGVKGEEKKESGQGAEADSYFSYGMDLYNQGNYQEAISYLRHAAGLKPDMAEAHQYLGASYYALGMVNESVEAYENYARHSNDPSAVEWLNNFKQQVGQG